MIAQYDVLKTMITYNKSLNFIKLFNDVKQKHSTRLTRCHDEELRSKYSINN